MDSDGLPLSGGGSMDSNGHPFAGVESLGFDNHPLIGRGSMDSDDELPLPAVASPRSCNCSCPCCGLMKRRLDKRPLAGGEIEFARVEAQNEAAALREALSSHHRSVGELYAELEEERSAAASAASEAMSMILRLQREKAESQMDARQYRIYAEEKIAHDQREIAALEDLLFHREQAIESLSCELRAFQHRLGIVEDPHTIDSATACQAFDHEYPPLRCALPAVDLYPFLETPRDHLQNLEQRICQLERMPSSSGRSVVDKRVVGQSPRWPRHLRKLSVDSYGSGWGSGSFRDLGQELSKGEVFPVDHVSDHGWRDDMSDRVYTIDTAHGLSVGGLDDFVGTPREFGDTRDAGCVEEWDLKKLYVRLQALEADRESMRQALVSMGTDKAQMVLLREIAQELCKEVTPERRVVKKPPFFRAFAIMTAIKWIVSSIFFWRKRSNGSNVRYTFGITANNIGLLLLLEKSSRIRQRRFMVRMQG